jgi:2-O-(6-phospho-alpha-D-mannosyl)-D-glycerate hydrolase
VAPHFPINHLDAGSRSIRALRYWVIPHTHWDREWYLPFEHFRFHLGRTVDEVLSVLEADERFRCFTLDGQAVVVEDYLEVRPEHEDRLRSLAAQGRIAIGPWYTLPDEYLVGGESLVRNLLAGRTACERIGRPMAVGYLPDTFGHVAQLPQILLGFGLDNLVFWRGLGDEAETVGSVFRWRGPDGSEVLAFRQLGGYGNANRLGGGDPAAAAERVRMLTERFAVVYERAGIEQVLLSNGDDHQPIQRGLPALLDAVSERLDGAGFRIATIEEYVDHVREAAGTAPVVEGELCGGGDIAVLRGVNSSRMWIKQANEATERELFVAEVLASLASLGGSRYPAAELALAWRELLRNHAHDSICGCSVDEVHRDMRQRFETACQIGAVVRRVALAALAGEGPPWSHRPLASDERTAVNVLPWPRRALVELELPPSLKRARRVIAESAGEIVPVQIDGGRALLELEVEGLGARGVRLRRGRVEPATSVRVVSQRAIENERLLVEVASDGTLAVTDRRSGETAFGLHLLEDCADRGDTYNFCPLEGDRPWTSEGARARARVVRSGPLVAELEISLTPRLPRGLARDRGRRLRATVPCSVATRVRLTASSQRLELRTTVENRARDHRLRVLFPVPGVANSVRVEGCFAVVERSLQPVWNGRWSEPPQTTHHTRGAVSAGGLTLLTKGLPEYEALPGADGPPCLAVTLLRCVGWLSRNDLSTRFHHAGPALETPGAQCLGSHAFEYALRLGELADAELVRASHDYRIGLELGPAGARSAGLSFRGDGFAMTAFKQAEDRDGLIARFSNPGRAVAEVAVPESFDVEACRLDETQPQPLVSKRLVLRPYELVTLRLRPRS